MKITVRIIVSVLIFLLAAASVVNIHTRAVQLHADGGWQTWFVSAGFAVSFALFAYLLIAFRKGFFIGAAAFCAIVTGIMQTGMYLALGADWATALGFGCGAPALEALLAMSEYYMDEPIAKKASAPGQMWARLGNAVISRIEAQPGSATTPQPVAPPQPATGNPQPAEVRREQLLHILSEISDPDEINQTQLGKRLGATRQQIKKDIDKLVADKRLSINGVVEVLQ